MVLYNTFSDLTIFIGKCLKDMEECNNCCKSEQIIYMFKIILKNERLLHSFKGTRFPKVICGKCRSFQEDNSLGRELREISMEILKVFERIAVEEP